MTVLVALHSIAFPGKYLRVDPAGATYPSGGGKVNTQTYIGTYETFKLIENAGGSVSFESTVEPNHFLRLDGAAVSAGTNVPAGSVAVNVQVGNGSYEKFKIIKKNNPPGQYRAVVGVESNQFPGRYLRVDGNKDQVNVQGIFGTFEEWEILVVGRV